MKNETHNGWTNYVTWRVMLEIFSGVDIRDITTSTEIHEVEEALKDYMKYITFWDNVDRLAETYALAYTEQANLKEIAEHMLQDVSETE